MHDFNTRPKIVQYLNGAGRAQLLRAFRRDSGAALAFGRRSKAAIDADCDTLDVKAEAAVTGENVVGLQAAESRPRRQVVVAALTTALANKSAAEVSAR